MRLIAQQAHQHPGGGGLAIEQQRKPAEQRRRQECVLPQPDGPEYRWEGEHRGGPSPAMRAQYRARHQKEGGQCRDLEHSESDVIRQGRQRGADQQINRGVEEELVGCTDAARRLLGEIMRILVVGECGGTGQHQLTGGVKADEIAGRRDRRTERAMLPTRDEHQECRLEAHENTAPSHDPVAIQPRRAAESVHRAGRDG